MPDQKNNNEKKNHFIIKFINNFFSWKGIYYQGCLILLLVIYTTYRYFSNISEELPSLNQLNKYSPEQATNIFSSDDMLIKQLYMHSSKREIIDIYQLPDYLIDALLIMEDREFYNHNGLDIVSVGRALIIDIVTMSTKQGASTITQQLARNMYNDPELANYIGADKTIDRKLKELLTAFNIEKVYTKSKILELYFNSVYFGHGNSGIQSASKHYFGKDAADLTLDESCILIGLLPAPARYSPITHPDRAIKRKELVLNKLFENNLITFKEYEEALSLPLPTKSNELYNSDAPYFTEYIRRELERLIKDEEYTDTNNNGQYDYNEEFIDLNNDNKWTKAEFESDIYKDGLTVNTTLDYNLQNILEEVFYNQMIVNQKKFNKDLLKDEERLKMLSSEFEISLDSLINIIESDSIIPKRYRPKLLVQGSVVIMDSEHGHILAMIGGRTENHYIDHFNRATQADRQPGSVFKPFVYLSAIQNGASPCTRLLNQPLVIYLENDKQYNPQNWDNSVGGSTTLRDGLRNSLNIVSVRVSRELTTPNKVVNLTKKFNFSSHIKPVESIALGVSEVKLLEITAAFSAISNNGIWREPIAITSIFDSENRKIKEFYSKSEEVADISDIFILRDMMKSVIINGTGRKIRSKYNFYNPVAGKTGTSQGKGDAWFIGFTPQITIGVWVGMDDHSMKLGQYGSGAALPIFAETISQLYDREYFSYNNVEIELANNSKEKKYDWDKPNDIVQLDVCKLECCTKTDWCESYKEYFKDGSLPTNDCDESLNNPLLRFEE